MCVGKKRRASESAGKGENVGKGEKVGKVGKDGNEKTEGNERTERKERTRAAMSGDSWHALRPTHLRDLYNVAPLLRRGAAGTMPRASPSSRLVRFPLF